MMRVGNRLGGAQGAWQFGLGLLLAVVMVAANPLMSVAMHTAGPVAALQADKTDQLDPRDGDVDIDPEFEELGLTSLTSYESPQFGFEVAWEDPWFVELVESPEWTFTSETETTPRYDMIRLDTEESDEAVFVYSYELEGSWLEDADDIPAAHVQVYTDYEAGIGLDDTGIESVHVLHEETDDAYGSVVYLISFKHGGIGISIAELRLIDDAFILAAASFEPTLFVESWESAREGIEIEGEPMFGFLDEDDVIEAVEAAIEEHDLGDGSAVTPDGEESPEGDDDLTYYLMGVRGAANALNDSVERFIELLEKGEDLSDDEVDKLNGILDLWASAPRLAIAGDPPAGVDDIHDLLLEYLDTLAEAADAFVDYARADDDEQEELGDQFYELMDDVEALYDDLIDELDAAEG